MRTTQVLLIDTWGANDRPDMSLTPTPGDQCTQQLAEVNPIGLRPTAAAIDLHARRINDEAFDAALLEEACQPEGVVSCFVAEQDRRASIRSKAATAKV